MEKVGKRWGKKVTYIRNWRKVNGELVKRGEFYLDFDWVQNWDKELVKMNEGKVGAPYEFPHSLIRLQAFWGQFLNYRACQGITQQLQLFNIIPNYNDYTTIWRRVTVFDEPLPKPKGKEISASTDGTGIKMNMTGEYFQEMYGDGKRKKYIKVTITADPFEKDLLKVEVSIEGEGLSEPEVAEKHMGELIEECHTIKAFYMDGAGDTHQLHDFCDQHNIEPVIKIRENAVVDPGGGSWRRAQEVEWYCKWGYKKWAEIKHYGRRWTGTEGIISAVKVMFGDRVRSKQLVNMCEEAKRRFWCYAVLKRYAEEKVEM